MRKYYKPERHIILSKVADTPEYLREYFKIIGLQEILNQFNQGLTLPIIINNIKKEIKEYNKQ